MSSSETLLSLTGVDGASAFNSLDWFDLDTLPWQLQSHDWHPNGLSAEDVVGIFVVVMGGQNRALAEL